MGYYSEKSSRLPGFFGNKILKPQTEDEKNVPSLADWKRNRRNKDETKNEIIHTSD